MEIDRVQIALIPWHYTDTPMRILKTRVDVAGREPVFVERCLPIDDVESHLDWYFDIIKAEFKKIFSDSRAEVESQKADVVRP